LLRSKLCQQVSIGSQESRGQELDSEFWLLDSVFRILYS